MEETTEFHANDMKVGAVIHGNAPIVSLAFHEEGEVLAAGSGKSSLYIIDALEYVLAMHGHYTLLACTECLIVVLYRTVL